ncbi:Cdc25 phosphatase Ibp1 [Sporothrix eucalyptigena]|uniref:Cdc25 phosphatase Ibp1 n=1 Tax=Sporothrix eucalyptigena TaxID=1812306 RepID=A0ABP0C9N3_9PEZI
MATIASLHRMTAAQLADRILAPTAQSLAIVDVRDDDYIGGHIKGSLHFASGSLDATLPTLLRKLQDAETVIFHCALSQQRGPGAALKYLREVSTQQQKASGGIVPSKPQTVYVLDRGFVGWQEMYGEDERLTEGYRKELWKYY